MEQTIQGSAQAAPDDKLTVALGTAIQNTYELLRRYYAQWVRHYTYGWPPASDPEYGHRIELAGYYFPKLDPVLCFTVADRAGLQAVRKAYGQSACEKYLEDPDRYDELLGDLIPQDFVADAQAVLARHRYARGSNETAADDWGVFEERLGERTGAPLSMVRTAIPRVDDSLGGGLRGLTFLGGHPGAGKTALALGFTVGALRAHPDLAVMLLSLDMSKDFIYERLLVAEAGVEQQALLTGKLSMEDTERLSQAEQDLRKDVLPRLRVLGSSDLAPAGGFSGYWLLDRRRELWKATRARQVLIIIDNFQLLPIPEAATDLERDFKRLDQINLVRTATASVYHPDGDPFLVISKVGKDARPSGLQTADLLGSTELGSRASRVMLLWRDPAGRPESEGVQRVTLALTKARDGGTCGEIPLLFDYRRCRYQDHSPGGTRGTAAPRTGAGATAPAKLHPGIDPLAEG
jgi:hypothetical protein